MNICQVFLILQVGPLNHCIIQNWLKLKRNLNKALLRAKLQNLWVIYFCLVSGWSLLRKPNIFSIFLLIIHFLSDEIVLTGVPLVGLQVSATFLHPQVCNKISYDIFFVPPSLLLGSLSKSWRRVSCMWQSWQTSGIRTFKPPPFSQVPFLG